MEAKTSNTNTPPTGTKRTICQKCGDEGYSELFIYCTSCRVSAEHRYCLDVLPKVENEPVIWTCTECVEKVSKFAQPQKSERFSLRRANSFRRHKKKWQIMNSSFLKAAISLTNELSGDANLTHKCATPRNAEVKNVCLGREISCNLEKNMEEGKLALCSESSSDEELKAITVKAPQSVSSADDTSRLVASQTSEESERKASREGGSELTKFQKFRFQHSPSINSECSVKNEVTETAEIRKKNGLQTRKRKLVLQDDSSSDESNNVKGAQSVPSEYSGSFHREPVMKKVSAYPIADAVWRGCFSMRNGKYGSNVGLAFHLSSKACLKVFQVATVLPPVLDIEVLPKTDAWPKSFDASPPMDDDIALYIFPEYERDEIVFDSILDDVIDQDLALRAMLDQAELLIFSSLELPEQHWRVCTKYYLWGVFRKKKGSCPPTLRLLTN